MAGKTETEERASASEVATLDFASSGRRKAGIFSRTPYPGDRRLLLLCALLVGVFLWWQYSKTYESNG